MLGLSESPVHTPVMVPVRTYWYPSEAALAKSVLENYEISCALLDENANRYGQAAFAMPVRLLVADDQADLAQRILAAAEDFSDVEKNGVSVAADSDLKPIAEGRQNPWEFLAIAFYFLLPGICALQIKYPKVVRNAQWTNWVTSRVLITHFMGWLAILFAVSLVALYFRIRSTNTNEVDKDPAPEIKDPPRRELGA